MAETWEMSFLVNQTTQIQEARGNLGRHFGMLQQVLIGRPLVNFVGAEDRLAFLRMMGKLSQRNWTETVAIRFRTPMGGERRVALQARPGSGPAAWWLMISEHGADAVPLIGDVETGDPMASEEEFGALVASTSAGAAPGEAPVAQDLSVFRTSALADRSDADIVWAAKASELEHRIGVTLRENATGGIVSNPERGHYALVHNKEITPQQIADKITVAADAVGVPAHALGLTHDTEPLPEDAAAKEVRELIHTMRQDLSERGKGGKKRTRPARPSAPAGAIPPVPVEPRKSTLLTALMGLIGRSPD
jgi:hypothetical protein